MVVMGDESRPHWHVKVGNLGPVNGELRPATGASELYIYGYHRTSGDWRQQQTKSVTRPEHFSGWRKFRLFLRFLARATATANEAGGSLLNFRRISNDHCPCANSQ